MCGSEIPRIKRVERMAINWLVCILHIRDSYRVANRVHIH
jgi:hypothetical protein